MKGKTNPIAKMMQTTDGRRLFGEKVVPAKKGKGTYKRKSKHKFKDEGSNQLPF